MSIPRCPFCNGPMEYPVQYERATVCIDCWDGLSGRTRGTTRRRWAIEDALAELAPEAGLEAGP